VYKMTFKFLPLMMLVAGLPLSAAAQDRELLEDTGRGPSYRFGDSGQLAISSDASIEIRHVSPSAGSSYTTITLAPAVDYFVIDGLSVGGFIALSHTALENSDFTVFGIGPRVGYNITLNDSVSIWPKVGFSFTSFSSGEETDGDGDVVLEESTGNEGIALNLFVPIMFHPAPHFFAGFGPFLDVDLSGDNKATYIGARLSLGGWFLL